MKQQTGKRVVENLMNAWYQTRFQMIGTEKKDDLKIMDDIQEGLKWLIIELIKRGFVSNYTIGRNDRSNKVTEKILDILSGVGINHEERKYPIQYEECTVTRREVLIQHISTKGEENSDAKNNEMKITPAGIKKSLKKAKKNDVEEEKTRHNLWKKYFELVAKIWIEEAKNDFKKVLRRALNERKCDCAIAFFRVELDEHPTPEEVEQKKALYKWADLLKKEGWEVEIRRNKHTLTSYTSGGFFKEDFRLVVKIG